MEWTALPVGLVIATLATVVGLGGVIRNFSKNPGEFQDLPSPTLPASREGALPPACGGDKRGEMARTY